VAAHAELGPRYNEAVAEGLVERIGEEIDKRIDARLGQPQPAQRAPGGNHSAHPERPAYQGPATYQGQAPAPAMAAAPPPAPRRAGGFSGAILGLGSMGLGVGATAVVVSHHVSSAAAVLMVLLIWAAIAIINIAHSQRKL
jgi:predicted lipid-binding transport protein (Tim44 family)